MIVKVGGPGAETARSSGAFLVNTNYPAAEAHLSVPVAAAPRLALEVSFRRGLLSVSSNKANLSEVLFAIHQQTGAEIDIPAGAEQEQVVADIGPAPAAEVLAQLLNGSKFNFLILSSTSDPRSLDRVILSSRPEGATPPPTAQRVQPRVVVPEDSEEDGERTGLVPRPATAVEKSDPADKPPGPSENRGPGEPDGPPN